MLVVANPKFDELTLESTPDSSDVYDACRRTTLANENIYSLNAWTLVYFCVCVHSPDENEDGDDGETSMVDEEEAAEQVATYRIECEDERANEYCTVAGFGQECTQVK